MKKLYRAGKLPRLGNLYLFKTFKLEVKLYIMYNL